MDILRNSELVTDTTRYFLATWMALKIVDVSANATFLASTFRYRTQTRSTSRFPAQYTGYPLLTLVIHVLVQRVEKLLPVARVASHT